MAEMQHGVDVYVCDFCKAIFTKPQWMMAGKKCPECGGAQYQVRGKFFDQHIYIDGFMACGDKAVWADWAKEGFLVGEPAPGLEKNAQR
jgi:hypothetical protein